MSATRLKVVTDDEVAKRNALEMVDELRERILAGDTVRFGLIEVRRGSAWSTSFSSGAEKLQDAAMLIDLGIRMLGFASVPAEE